MAYYNPKPVSFQPSQAVIKGAGAVGGALRDASDNLFMREMKRDEDERLMKQFGLDVEKHNYDKAKLYQDMYSEQQKAQKDFLAAQGKLTGLEQYQPELYNQIESKYGNDPQSMAYMAEGASSFKSPTVKGTFKESPDGKLHYVTSDGAVNDLGFEVRQDDPKITNTMAEFQAYADAKKAQGLPAPSFNEFYDQKQNSKKFGVGLRDYDESQLRVENFAQKHGLQKEQLANIDVDTLPEDVRYEFNQIVGGIEQAQRDRIPSWAKKEVTSLSQVVHSAGEIAKLIKSNDSGLLNNMFNQVNKYLGLGDDTELIRKSMTQSSYALYRNYMLKILSGTAVSAQEGVRFTQGFGDLWHSDKATAGKAYQNMASLRARLQTLKNSYNPIVFNYRYGDLLRNVDTALDRMHGVLNGKATKVNSRADVIDELQSRGATAEQIEAYLQKKGL